MPLDVFSEARWAPIMDSLESLGWEPDARNQVMARWLNKYLRAVMQAESQEWEDKAWLALYSYLTYPSSARKPFSLAPLEADTFIAALQDEVHGLKSA